MTTRYPAIIHTISFKNYFQEKFLKILFRPSLPGGIVRYGQTIRFFLEKFYGDKLESLGRTGSKRGKKSFGFYCLTEFIEEDGSAFRVG
jgi:hypothetical protein